VFASRRGPQTQDVSLVDEFLAVAGASPGEVNDQVAAFERATSNNPEGD
jgi:hypothetical protein